MAKLLTLTQLQDAMSDEFAWRKKELTSLKSLVDANQSGRLRNLFIRAAITLLYAHWEGFVRQIGSHYLQFVALQGLKNEELPPNFISLIIHGQLRAASESSSARATMDIVRFFRSEGGKRCRLNWKTGIKTRANLRSEVFREIVETLGLDYSQFATKEKLVDEKLIHNRNNIAHGEYSVLSHTEYMGLHGGILWMMQEFYDQVETAAFNGRYRLQAPE